jgi:hypothetical protein
VKPFKVALGLLLACLPSAFAQVLIEVNLDQQQFLSGESIAADVRIINRSGRTLHLGKEADWLTFSVESRNSFIINKNGETPVIGEFTLENARVATKRVDLAPYFELTRSGHYQVIATLNIKDWGAQTASKPKDFDIIEGSPLWTREFGVPGTGNSNQAPEIRRYTLLQANTLRSEIRLYFRLSEPADSRVLKVFQLGQLVSFARPEIELDSKSRVHVLQQNGAHTLVYTVINPEGQISMRRFYEFAEGRPTLRLSREGEISVLGGNRKITRNDIPLDKSFEKDDQ